MKYLKSYEIFESLIQDPNKFIIEYNGFKISWNHNLLHNLLTRIGERTGKNIDEFNKLFLKFLEKLKKEVNLENDDQIGCYFFKSGFKLIIFVLDVAPLSIMVATALTKGMFTKDITKTILLNETFFSDYAYTINKPTDIMELTPKMIKCLRSHFASCYKNDLGVYAPINEIVENFIKREALTEDEEVIFVDAVQDTIDFMNESGMDDDNRLTFEDYVKNRKLKMQQ